MKKVLIIVLVIFIVVALISSKKELFSDSGLAISDRYCQKLTDVYYQPNINCPECRAEYTKNICGHKRRHTITDRNGNYFYDYGVRV